MNDNLDIELAIRKFASKLGPTDRYASFDYCYNYFLKNDNLTRDVEKSCLVLGFYLASWGMYRGSSFLRHKSAKHLESTVKYIATLPMSVWEIDVDTYTDQNIQTIVSTYNEVKWRLIPNNNADLTLISKVLLGVFGFVPAFDKYFTTAFRRISGGECGFRRLNVKSLEAIRDFYEKNRATIDRLAGQTFTTDFSSGLSSKINYPKAKIIDMYGFTIGNSFRESKESS